MTTKEKRYLLLVTVFGLISVILSILDLIMDFYIPGLNPMVSAVFWFSLWRLMRIRRQFPGGIWTFMYILIIFLNLTASISQIINVIA